ncbi:M48 family metalloprotease [Rhodobacterales bacterium HKCCE2091]|nr:M48 family metalloprotease [Rhodobacterales bacterium HKCCE2091]
MSGYVEHIRNEAFAAKLALTYSEFFDGISPVKQRVSLRISDNALEIKNVETMQVTRWPLKSIREVPDLSDKAAVIFAGDNEDPARLVIREAEALQTLVESGAPLHRLRGPRGQLRRLGVMGVIAAACFGGLLFGLVPWFANAAAERIPAEAEIAMGQELFNQIYVGTGSSVCTAPDGVAALETMQARLTSGADLPLPLTLRVVRNGTVNATALPGGQVTIHSALIEAAESPDEVAAVLAHEIGHVAHRDGTRGQLRAMGSYGLIGLLFGDVFGFSAAAGVTGAVLDASYTRDAEARADAFAHEMLETADVSPAALGTFFERLAAAEGDMDLGLLRHLSTHPETLERIEAARHAGEVSAATGTILSDGEWASLRTICSIDGSGGALDGEIPPDGGKL